MNFLLLLTLTSLPILSESSLIHTITGGEDIWSELCTEEVRDHDKCKLIHGLKIWNHRRKVSSDPEAARNMTLMELKRFCDDRFGNFKVLKFATEIVKDPEITRNMTLTQLKESCDNRFVCLENTYCYKDSYNYELLDECIEEIFQKGPMFLCVKKLKEILKKEPNKLASCVKDQLEKADTTTMDCKEIQKTGECYLPDIEKYCDRKFAPMYKQYLSLRLYNLACDGRLRYRVPGDRPQNVLNSTEATNSTI